MPGVPIEYNYPILALLLFGIVLSFIPKEEVRRLFWISFLWGYLESKLSVFIFSKIFKCYQYRYAMPFEFLGAPHWLVLGWTFTLMIYFYFLPKTKEWYAFPIYLFAFTLTSTALDKIMNQIGLLEYINWNPFYRFIIALLLFYAAARHYRYLIEKNGL